MNDDGKNTGVIIGLHAVVVSVTNDQPRLLVVGENEISGGRGDSANASLAGGDALPYGPFDPTQHRTLESGLRAWVSEQTELDLGYVEQLYTFGDRGRDPRERQGGPRLVSVGYLALVSEAVSVPASNAKSNATSNATWQNWYHFLPWEDWREGAPLILERVIEPHLSAWAEEGESEFERDTRHERIDLAFGFTTNSWNEKLVLERYELLYEAGFVQESLRDRGCPIALESDRAARGRAMLFDHRRIAATALGRLRGKIEYRPVIFELMAGEFTLLQLQRAVEALAGTRLHKQNFRRLVEKGGLVEPTGRFESQTGGRPAEQFRFRRDVLLERLAPGVKLPGRRHTT